jgi:hypothetical protein
MGQEKKKIVFLVGWLSDRLPVLMSRCWAGYSLRRMTIELAALSAEKLVDTLAGFLGV